MLVQRFKILERYFNAVLNCFFDVHQSTATDRCGWKYISVQRGTIYDIPRNHPLGPHHSNLSVAMADLILNNYIRATFPVTDTKHVREGVPAGAPVALKKKFNPGLEEVS